MSNQTQLTLDEAYKNGLACGAQVREQLRSQVDQLTAERDRLREALRSIAANTCCDNCQEAALVAQQALKETGESK